ncbi:hypothetical protein J6590_076531 [Homalodisca vitripennis]|nr:hypothetical protein J6590_076531 [Homalodisca vitripennis]
MECEKLTFVQSMGVPMAERSKSLDFGSELEITQVQILSVTFARFISTVSTLPLLLSDKIFAQASGP